MKVRASYHQERLWFIDRFEAGNLYDSSPIYHNIPLILEIDGPLQIDLLEQSLQKLINRHEALRTRIIDIDSQPFQFIDPGANFKLEVIRWQEHNRGTGSDNPVNLALEAVNRPFSLDRELLIRGLLIGITIKKYILAISTHHIISDRYSLGIFVEELWEYYEAGVQKRSPRLKELSLHYADFSQWQQEFPPKMLESLLFYWKRQLGGDLQPLELPTDNPRSSIHVFQAERQSFRLTAELSRRIQSASRQKGISAFILLLAALKVLFHRYSGQDEIIVGTSVDNRGQPGTAPIVGPVANLLVLRSHLSPNSLFDKVLADLDKTVKNAVKYQDIPFDQLVQQLNPAVDMSRTALFDVLFQYIEKPVHLYQKGNLTARVVETNLGWGKYDLNFYIGGEETFSGVLVYNRKYYNASTIARLIAHYKILLEILSRETSRRISNLSFLTEEERRQLLIQWNQTRAHYPKDKTLHQIFEEQAEQTPDHIALVGKEEEWKSRRVEDEKDFGGTHLTYRELNEKSNQLAHVLWEKGLHPDTIAAIMMEPSVEMIIGILGILKSGGAYLPIDPGYPEERINYMLKDSCARILLKKSEIRNPKSETNPNAPNTNDQNKISEVTVLNFEHLNFEFVSNFDIRISNLSSSSLAYIIYTSGTTGKPKGCMITHGNVVRLLKNDKFPYRFGTGDVWPMVHSFCFDFSVWEMYGALLYGGRLILPDRASVQDTDVLLSMIKVHKVTVLNQTPSSFYHLLEEEKKSGHKSLDKHLRFVIFGGEKLEPHYLKDWTDYYSLTDIRLINMYGITETTVHVTYYKIKENDIHASGKGSPIGTAIPETTLYIFDRDLNLVPVGVVGEMYVGGTGVARGYLNRVRLTTRRFIKNPHKEGETIYKTGDLARWSTGGGIQYIGRNDAQVKIRGYRVELGEIENRLSAREEITEAVVVANRKGEDKYSCLYAYFVSPKDLNITALREYLSGQLPGYMIPSYFVQMARLPLTPNGKIDKKALPEPDVTVKPGEYEPPHSQIEKKLVKIWSEILSIEKEKIGIKSNFFELGGHSLKATTLISDMHKVFDVKMPLVQVFMAPVLGNMARYIETAKQDKYASIQPIEKKSYYPLSSAQKRMYLLQQMELENINYNISRVVVLAGVVHRKTFAGTFHRLIKRHESLRTSFHMVENEPLQKIHDEIGFDIQFYRAGENEVEEIVKQYIKAFDLGKAPLFRVGLVDVANDTGKHILMVEMHHIIADGVSDSILVREFMALYGEKELAPLRLQYKDYSEWQNRLVAQGEIKHQENYWLKVFAGEIPVLNMPTDYPRPENQSFQGEALEVEIGAAETGAMHQLVLREEATLFILLLAIFNILLAKMSGNEDIVVGTPIVSRRHSDLKEIIGMFVNTLALRNRPHSHKTFKTFLREVRESTLTAYENQEYPFENLVEKVVVNRDASRNPLFDAILVLQNMDRQRIKIPGLQLMPYNYKNKITKFDLTLSCLEAGERLFLTITYCTKLFKKGTIRRFSNYFKKIVSIILNQPGIRLGEIEIISEEEKKQLLYDFNDTAASYPEDKTIRQLFEEQVERTPEHIALLGHTEGTRGLAPLSDPISITYNQLNRKSNQLASMLRQRGIEPDTMAALLLEPSPGMITAVMGVLKAGGAYLPIDPDTPGKRVLSILEDAHISIILTEKTIFGTHPFTTLQDPGHTKTPIHLTATRSQITDFDGLPVPDRSLVNYEKYNRYIGQAMTSSSIALQATRGCPYNCAYCHKIWPKKHVVRSAENIFSEVKLYYDIGFKKFVIIDDIFNLDRKNSAGFFDLIIENGLDVRLFFPNGLRGDILTREYIDLMVKAGTVSLALALETASPRLQQLIKKNMNLEKLRENIEYFCEKYPHVILELFTMHGFPTETEEEAQMTLNFIRDFKWLHFPYIHILKIYPNTEMEKMALENGVSRETIAGSANLAYHELTDALPFDKSAAQEFQADFLNGYFLSKERLLHVLPHQMRVLTEKEILQKYNSYLPAEINSFSDLLQLAGINEDELGIREFFKEDCMAVPHLNEKIREIFPRQKVDDNALKVLFLDLSQFFGNADNMLYDVVEPPLGLMYLVTFLKRQFGGKINGKIAKSRIDFDNYTELKALLDEFAPDVIGIRSLTFYKDLFHQTAAMIRQWGINVPILAGGPYATSDYVTILQDRNVDLVVLSEGEVTAAELFNKIIENEGKLPPEEVLKNIAGIAFVPYRKESRQGSARELVMIDALEEMQCEEPTENPVHINKPTDLAYIIFTSGTTGKPKGTLIENKNVVRLMVNNRYPFDFGKRDVWTMSHSYCFDFSVWEMYGALLYGGRLLVIPRMVTRDPWEFLRILRTHNVTVLNQTPSAFYNLMSKGLSQNPTDLNLRYVIFGGEALNPLKLKDWHARYPQTKLINMFGITETTVHVTFKEITPDDIKPNKSNIGKPIPTLTTYILDRNSNLLPIGVAGELCVGGAGVGRGYLNRPGLTAEKFLSFFYRSYKSYMTYIPKKIYKSGDLARWLTNGDMEYLGRIDHQVKIRGFRIEPGEIESHLLTHAKIKDAVVIAREGTDKDRLLCAYIVPHSLPGGDNLDVSGLREYLARRLADYMIPSYFIKLEKIPLNINGKVDRKRLPAVEPVIGDNYAAPRDEPEKKLVEIWSEVLQIKKELIGIDSDFFHLGGHSLKATLLLTKIHKEFDVRIPLGKIFNFPTIEKQAEIIQEALPDKYSAITLAEKKEYYELSSAQQRLYIIQQMEIDNTSYNIPIVVVLMGGVQKEKLEHIFFKLIQRHENLRTSFVMIGNKVVQKIRKQADLKIEYYETNEKDAKKIVNGFVRPFDLSKELLRVGLIKIDGKRRIFMVDIHHIISDGVTMNIIIKEFIALYGGNEQLPPLKVQYKDYSEWQNSCTQSERIKAQKEYWLKQFAGEIPVLDFPTDYPRPTVLNFEGDQVRFRLDRELVNKIKRLEAEVQVTCNIVLLSIFYILLSKYTGQEDIVVGTPITGRSDVDLQNIGGMFVNTLPLRNKPESHKTFGEFLQEVKESAFNGYENQDYQFDELVVQLGLQGNPNRNPLINTTFTFQNSGKQKLEIPNVPIKNLKLQPYKYEIGKAKFDLTLDAVERNGSIIMLLRYLTILFKRETIEKIEEYYMEILEQVVENNAVKLKDITLSHDFLTVSSNVYKDDGSDFKL